jgi:hypothetical protein
VGPFGLDEAVSLERRGVDALLPASAITRVLVPCPVDAAVAVDVGHGKVLEAQVLGLDPDPASRPAGPWAVLGPDGALLAVYDAHRGTTVKPSFVLS